MTLSELENLLSMPNIRPKQKSVPFSEEEMKAAAWCLNKGIGISLLCSGHGSQKYYVDIDNNGKRNHSSDLYDYYNGQRKVYEYYLYYYKKYAKENEKI